MGKFEIKPAKNGEYVFNLKAGNGEVILSGGETYTSVDSAKKGCESVKTNAKAPVEDQTVENYEKLGNPKYELYKDNGGEFRFRLKAGNGVNIGRSEGYKAKASAQNGIESIGKNAPDAPIVVVEE